MPANAPTPMSSMWRPSPSLPPGLGLTGPLNRGTNHREVQIKMLVIAYGLLGLTGFGVIMLACCLDQLQQIRRTLVERNKIAAAHNAILKRNLPG